MSIKIRAAERGLIPDRWLRFGIRRICAARLRDEAAKVPGHPAGSGELRSEPIAVEQQAANRQHYELPAEFFERTLGPHRKYSCCLWRGDSTLAEAEESMLRLSCERARLEDGMSVLDLGCGWGSLSLFIAQHYPSCRVLAVSNSTSQRRYIEEQGRKLAYQNLEVRTADVATLELPERFDRILSVEMFEHMRNYDRLLERIAGWLKPDGRLFVHIFGHERYNYLYESAGDNDWMARTFFTGGQMPSAGLLREIESSLEVEEQWHIDGRHYELTANAWLDNLDRNRAQVEELFRGVYGEDQASLWLQRWRIFFMACAEMFGFSEGSEWGVEHLLFRRATSQNSPDLL